MIDIAHFYGDFFTLLSSPTSEAWLNALPKKLEHFFEKNEVHFNKWKSAIEHLPNKDITVFDFNAEAISIGNPHDVTPEESMQLYQKLKHLKPWRKGPFNLFDIKIDTEWQSNLKWDRLKEAVSLKNKTILDVGCGNGYYAFRMLGAGAHSVVGIDPSLLYLFQWKIMHHFSPLKNAYVLPLTLEEIPKEMRIFDTVFSMGVLYHRKSPIEHLTHLKNLLKPGGQLVLETLVIEGDENTVLLPQNRYAGMSNVWFIFSVALIHKMLARLGFQQIETINISTTTQNEQRKTQWIGGVSLEHFLNEKDPHKTIEDHSAPIRAVITAYI